MYIVYCITIVTVSIMHKLFKEIFALATTRVECMDIQYHMCILTDYKYYVYV